MKIKKLEKNVHKEKLTCSQLLGREHSYPMVASNQPMVSRWQVTWWKSLKCFSMATPSPPSSPLSPTQWWLLPGGEYAWTEPSHTQHCFVPLGSSMLLESSHSHSWFLLYQTLTTPYHMWNVYQTKRSDTATDSFVSYPHFGHTPDCSWKTAAVFCTEVYPIP